MGLKLFHASEGWTEDVQVEKDTVRRLGVKESEYCVFTILYDTSRSDTTTVLGLTIETWLNRRKTPGFGRHILLTKIYMKVQNKPITHIRYDWTVGTNIPHFLIICAQNLNIMPHYKRK